MNPTSLREANDLLTAANARLGELEAANATQATTLTEVNARVTQLTADLDASASNLVAANARADQATARVGELEAKVKALEASQVSAEQKAAHILAGVGIEAVVAKDDKGLTQGMKDSKPVSTLTGRELAIASVKVV